MARKDQRTRVLIMGAAGRDFHNFNAVYRDDPQIEVVAFTADQIPEIAGRRYPPELAGPLYPEGIPIFDGSELAALCRDKAVDRVVFAYSDIDYAHVMHRASVALAAGADFVLLGPDRTMLTARVPVIAICAVRTGCGKSQTARWISRRLRRFGLKAAVIRHPMPYGNLTRQKAQRFTTLEDLDAADCTIEEREEYEPHIEAGNVVFAGADYGEILKRAEAEADIILWDGGNNDFPFYRPDLTITMVDPFRAGHETAYHPGEAVLRMADIVLVAKANTAEETQIGQVVANARAVNPGAKIRRAHSDIELEDAAKVRGKRVLVIEDGPTITHGGMPWGAGYIAAKRAEASEIVDPRGTACDSISVIFDQYPHIGPVLPALGYYPQQLSALRETINATPADLVISGTPCDLSRLIEVDKPILRARYEYAEAEEPGLGALVEDFLREKSLMGMSD
ncbi:MAG: cyclic 2,3-diphosphoglycerate synthase [Thalassovita sp.]|nr:cyclic 2,3-diphosphoglycerate synthase [Thalassovita sp.]